MISWDKPLTNNTILMFGSTRENPSDRPPGRPTNNCLVFTEMLLNMDTMRVCTEETICGTFYTTKVLTATAMEN